MALEIMEPQQRLSKNAVKVWLIKNVLTSFLLFILLGILFYVHDYFGWEKWVYILLIIATGLTASGFVWSMIKPFLLYKNWRYDVDEEFLQFKLGALNEEHHLIPMTKIQSVATRQGPILRMYKLYSVTIDTMGSSHTIPALPEEVGRALRNQIGQYAKIKEVES